MKFYNILSYCVLFVFIGCSQKKGDIDETVKSTCDTFYTYVFNNEMDTIYLNKKDGAYSEKKDLHRLMYPVLKEMTSIYGYHQLKREEPFNVEENEGNNEEWHIYGTLPSGVRGGVLHIIISKRRAQVERYWHEE